jgi:hypothetical protein
MPQRFLNKAILLLLLGATTVLAPAQTKPKFIPEDESLMTASDVAKSLGLQRLFEWIMSHASSSNDQLKLVMARQKLFQEVTIASLQVDAAAGQIDDEIAEARELQNYLEGKLEREIGRLNLVSLVAGGTLGTASASLGLIGEGKTSSITGILAGGVTAGLSTIGLIRRSGSGQPLQVPSNMLANLFNRPVVGNNVYPPFVSRFMQAVAPNEKEGLNRQQRLIHDWIAVGRIPELSSKKGQERVDLLTSMPSQGRSLSIRDLNDRQAMLSDFRAKLLYLKRDLTLLLTNIPNDFTLE